MPSHVPKYGNFFEFRKDDVFHNTLKVHPRVSFYIYSGSVYYNNENSESTNFHTPNGHINLYDLNVNRNNVSSSDDPQMIYPFITKGGSFTSFSTISTDNFNLDFTFGDQVTGSYPLTAGISIDRYGTSFSDEKKNVLYVRLKYYVSGTLIAEAADTLRNGVLYQTTGSLSGSVGVVLYSEGFIMLTSSANISSHTEDYAPGAGALNSSWHYFGATGSYAGAPSSSFSIDFNGENYIQTMTYFAHAKENQINFSNNPTFLSDKVESVTTNKIYHEDSKMNIKNIVSSSYSHHSASYQPVTYISKIGLYDENKNLIAVASLANPVRKLENRSYTFKLKLDI